MLSQFVYLFFCSWRFGLFSILGSQTILLWTFCQLQCKLHVGRDFACFVWSCLLRHSQCLEQCRTHDRCSVNIWGMNEFLYMSPGARVEDLLQRHVFSKCGPGTLRVPETFPGGLWGQNYHHKTVKTLFVLFTLIFHELKYFPDKMTSSLWQLIKCVLVYYCVLKMPLLISVMVKIDKYNNPHKQQLFEVLIIA